MIIQLEKNIKKQSKEKLLDKIRGIDYQSTEVKTQRCTYLVCIGKIEFDIRSISNMDGVKDVHRVSDDYKLVSKKWKVHPTVIDLGDGVIISSNNGKGKDDGFAIMAGPCSIESEQQIEKMVKHLVKNNVRIMRGGVYKPRSSPYSFRGLGMDGLKLFHNICKAHGIKIITEVMQVSQVEPMYDYIDIYQVGTRNSQNYDLLDALGKVDKPVLIKRAMSGTIDELLHSAEYVFSSGNERLILCERGIRTYERTYRNTLDINAIPVLKEKTHLPVIIDPSHGIGIRRFIEPLALASVMAGADGILIEIHENPEKAYSDGQQSLNFEEADRLFKRISQTYILKNNF